VAGEHPKIAYEKYPVVFDIDMLRCVFCGFCVDACPKDAIWMTRDYEMAFFNREEAIFGIDKLVAKPGLPVKDGLGYRPYYPGDGTVPPGDASSSPVIPGDGERAKLREKGIDAEHTTGPGALNRSLDGSERGQLAVRHQPMVKSESLSTRTRAL
jgi:ferredoxin